MKTLLILTNLILYSSALFSQDNLHENPDNVQFITPDIENFWKAYDHAKGKGREEQLKIYREEYINQAQVKGTFKLNEYEIKTAPGCES